MNLLITYFARTFYILCHDSALLVEHICQFQLLWVYTFLYNSSLNEVFPKGQLAPWVGQDAPLPRASRPLEGNLPHGRGRFALTVIYKNSLYFLCCRTCNPRVCITVSFIVISNIDIHHIHGNTKTTRGRSLGGTARWLQLQPSSSWPRRRKRSKMFSLCTTRITARSFWNPSGF